MADTIIKKLQKLKLIHSPGEIRKLVKSYGAEIGYLAINWNRLHDTLCKIFAIVVKSQFVDLSEAVWHSTESDYAQRKMLREALPHAASLTSEQRDCILWILNKIDDQLRHSRNVAIHAPVMTSHKLVGRKAWVKADEYSHNPKAKLLRGKDLMKEFKLDSALALALSNYAITITRSLNYPERFPWPEKPSLPHANQTKSRKVSSRQNKPR